MKGDIKMPVHGKKKTYVLDTSILVHSPYALYTFDEHNVCIADITVEELDNLKTRPSEVGANTREAIRIIDKLRQEGDLTIGVQLPKGGGSFRVELNHVDAKLPDGWDPNKPDNRILRVCKGLHDDGQTPILVSNDIAMRVKAGLIGVPAEEYKTEQVKAAKDQYKGRSTVYVKPDAIAKFYRDKLLSVEDIIGYTDDEEASIQLALHEFVMLVNSVDLKNTALGRFNGHNIVPLLYQNVRPYGVVPRNVGQKFAQEALMANVGDIPLVILKGPAGTAKTFYSLAVGLERVVNDSQFMRILVARPNIKFDEDIGFLKGSEEDKITPLIRPIMDNLESLTRIHGCDCKDGDDTSRAPDNYTQDLFDNGYIVAQAMAYMRGRSISDTWVIIDEAQNMTPDQAFGIISRAGVGSKIILAGDPDQIDNPRLDSRTNGLSYASERMKGSPLCQQVTFAEAECTRSQLALEAISRLSPKGYHHAE